MDSNWQQMLSQYKTSIKYSNEVTKLTNLTLIEYSKQFSNNIANTHSEIWTDELEPILHPIAKK